MYIVRIKTKKMKRFKPIIFQQVGNRDVEYETTFSAESCSYWHDAGDALEAAIIIRDADKSLAAIQVVGYTRKKGKLVEYDRWEWNK